MIEITERSIHLKLFVSFNSISHNALYKLSVYSRPLYFFPDMLFVRAEKNGCNDGVRWWLKVTKMC